MADDRDEITHIDPWQQLKSFTRARIAIGRVGSSLPTKEVLDFGLSHAMARDAVHLPLDVATLTTEIEQLGLTTLHVQSKAPERASYLLRPDWGRRLNEQSLNDLKDFDIQNKNIKQIDLLIVVADGLSSLAVSRHAAPMIAEICKLLPENTQLAPIVIASQARVAIGDEIGDCGARPVGAIGTGKVFYH